MCCRNRKFLIPAALLSTIYWCDLFVGVKIEEYGDISLCKETYGQNP